MGWRCRGCGVLRTDRKIRCDDGDKLQCTRTYRLCTLFDTRLIDHAPRRTLGEYQELDRILVVDYVTTLKKTAEMPIPVDRESFVSLIQGLHFGVFGRALPHLAGQFRTDEVTFGPQQRFEGCNWKQITDRLRQLFKKCGFDQTEFATLTRDRFVRKLALFLEAFFMVHPFPDGNGRVARAFTSMLCHHSKRWAFKASRNDGGNHRQRRKYDRALTYAHDGLPQGELPPRVHRDLPYYFLDRWIGERLTDVVPDNELIEEPPSRPSSIPPPG